MWLFLNACNQWLRTNLGWSNTPQAWRERLCGFLILAGIVALFAIGWGGQLTFWHQLTLWLLWLGSVLLLIALGWIKLLGPVLFYDMIRVARRSRYIWIRMAYILVLFVLLTWVYSMWEAGARFGTDASMDRNRMSQFAESLFYTFMLVQLGLTVVLTPGYVAGAIAEEKDRKTLEYLLATDLRNQEIVLSKLVSRLANLLFIVLAGLPVLSFVQFFGGVDPDLLLAGFAATGLIMASLAGVSILCSVHARKPRDAIILTYLIVVGYHVISFLSLFLLNWTPAAVFTSVNEYADGLVMGTALGVIAYLMPATPISIELANVMLADLSQWGSDALFTAIHGWNSGNLVLALVELVRIVATDQPLNEALPGVLGRFAWFHGLIAVSCCLWAVVRLRGVALREPGAAAVKQRWTARLFGRPAVGDQPMLWKEIFAEPGLRFKWLGRILILMLIGLSFVPAILILYFYFESWWWSGGSIQSLGRDMNVWVRIVATLVACLTLLAVAVRASGALSGERDRQTFDGLLTTPLESSSILIGKWAGSIASVRWSWLWLGGIWWLGAVTGGLHLVSVPLLLIAWTIYAGCFACIGLWFSLVCRTTLRATLWTLLTVLACSLGHWLGTLMCCIGPSMLSPNYSERDLEYLMKFQAGQTPPLVLGLLAFQGEELRGWRAWDEGIEMIGHSLFGLGTWLIAGLMLGGAIYYRFQELTFRSRMPPSRRELPPPTLSATIVAEPAAPVETLLEVVSVEGEAPVNPVWIMEPSDGDKRPSPEARG